TGAFCYSPTSACTFELAKILVEHGADPARIAQNVYFSSPTSKMRLLGAALSNLQREGVLTWMSVTRQDMDRCGALEEDCEGLVNYALGIAGGEGAVFFRETKDERVRISIRSKGAVNVADMAEKFGGGGHTCASGFSLAGSLAQAEKTVLNELRSKLPETSSRHATDLDLHSSHFLYRSPADPDWVRGRAVRMDERAPPLLQRH